MSNIPIVQIEPTNQCNRNCDICMRGYQNRPIGFMDYEDFKKFIDLNKPSYVGFHGWGEPLLHNNIVDMVSYASSKGCITSLITNGFLLDQELIQKLFTAGLKELAFGVYKLSILKSIADRILLASKIKRRMNTKRPEIIIDITVYQGNKDEILDIIKEAFKLGVEKVNLHRIFNLHNPQHKALSKDEEQSLFKRIKELAKDLKLKIIYPKEHGFPCRIAKYSVFITWDFKITPCCFLIDVVLAQGPQIRLGDLTRLESYKKFLGKRPATDICSKCII